MDKYEYRMRTEQMLAYIDQKEYSKAMEIADTIDWRRVKNTVILCATSEVYEKNERYDKSRDVLFVAYDKAPENKKIIYRLGVLALKQEDIEEAMDCYDEFVAIAPKDPNQYILKYKILRLKNSSLLAQIETLKTFKSFDYTEKWAFELARLYDEAGMKNECIIECDEIVSWFVGGSLTKQVLDLKKKYTGLSPVQEEAYRQCVLVKPEVITRVRNTSSEMSDLGETKVISPDEINQINQAVAPMKQQKTVVDTVKVPEAEDAHTPVANITGTDQQIVVRGTPIVPKSVVSAVVGLGAVSDKVPIKTRTSAIAAETTGQLRIDEILTGWEEKQKKVEEAIAIEKQKSEERLALEAKYRQEKKQQEDQKTSPVLPEIIRKMIEDMEGTSTFDDLAGKSSLEEEVYVNNQDEVNEREVVTATNKSGFNEDAEYIEEEFHDNVFEAEEEYKEFVEENSKATFTEQTSETHETQPRNIKDTKKLEQEKSSVEVELENIEAILTQGDMSATTEINQAAIKLNQDNEQNLKNASESNVEHDLPMEFDLSQEHTPLSRIEVAKAVATGRTAKLPIEDIAKAALASGVEYDTGFIVQARYDMDDKSQVGLLAGLTQEQQQMFSYFVPVRGMSEQLVDVLDRDVRCTGKGGTSSTGNLLIVGHKGSGKTVLAVDVVKAIQKNRGTSNGKVAIVTGEALNKKKISDIVSKLYGGALIIEKASKMNEKTITRLNKAMERDTGEILVVLEDERKPLDTLLATNLEFRRRFTSRLEVPVFINDELVRFGQTYAQENGCNIDEMGILALYSCIDREQKENYNVSVADVKDIVDDAIENSQKGGVKRLAKKLFKKDGKHEDRVILTEKNFDV